MPPRMARAYGSLSTKKHSAALVHRFAPPPLVLPTTVPLPVVDVVLQLGPFQPLSQAHTQTTEPQTTTPCTHAEAAAGDAVARAAGDRVAVADDPATRVLCGVADAVGAAVGVVVGCMGLHKRTAASKTGRAGP